MKYIYICIYMYIYIFLCPILVSGLPRRNAGTHPPPLSRCLCYSLSETSEATPVCCF